jgi:hypothetical protein
MDPNTYWRGADLNEKTHFPGQGFILNIYGQNGIYNGPIPGPRPDPYQARLYFGNINNLSAFPPRVASDYYQSSISLGDPRQSGVTCPICQRVFSPALGRNTHMGIKHRP